MIAWPYQTSLSFNNTLVSGARSEAALITLTKIVKMKEFFLDVDLRDALESRKTSPSPIVREEGAESHLVRDAGRITV